jgi:hypothetical protein
MGIAYHLRGKQDSLAQPGVRFAGIIQNLAFLIAVVAMVFVIAKA